MRSPVSLKIKRKLNALEKDLRSLFEGADSEIRQSYTQTITAGGKRIRPAIVFLCSQFAGADEANVRKAAVSVELIHAASLIHDDIMDGARLRRGMPTVYSKWGSQVALRIGDYLFAQAFFLLNETGHFEAVGVLSSAVKQLSEGEIEQIKSAFDTNQAFSYYLLKIRCKTASLFRASAELGAIFGNAPKSTVKVLGGFAENLGMAFQVFDDILDINAEEKVLGKSLGADLRDGTLTLPILYALKEAKSRRLADIFTSEKCSEAEIKEGLEIILASTAVEKARAKAQKFVDKALSSIEAIDNKRLKKELTTICEYTIERYN